MIRPFGEARRICVVGAGPVGSLAALLLARQGAQVDLLEARPDQVRRLGGEWLHPAAVEILNRAVSLPRLTRPDFPTGQGFVVVPEDGSEPIRLDYPPSHPAGSLRLGTSFEHAALVTALREAATSAPGVNFLPFARLTAVCDQTVEFVDQQGATRRATADLVIGADGRSSRVRQCLGLRRQQMVSCMAGVPLESVSLPHEGYGHVFVGAPGPMLAYRVDCSHVRLCVDVPARYCKEPDLADFVRRHYAGFLPADWREPFRHALAEGQIAWAKNEIETREVYGAGRIRLVGDAVGCLHPITASGMTLGFQDVACLASFPSLRAYQRQRRAACRVPQALASSLYAALAGQDESAQRIRQSIYDLLRQGESQRLSTMQLLCGDQTSLWQFQRVFLTVGAMGIRNLLGDIVASRQWREPSSAWRRIHRQIRWLDRQISPVEVS